MNAARSAAYVFDLYGTLVDYGSLAERYSSRSIDGAAFVAAWRQKQLQYAFTSTLMERYVDFDTLTGLAYAYVAAGAGLPVTPGEQRAAVQAWSELPAFPDAAPALRGLRSRGWRTAVLSNGTPAAIETTLRNCGLAGELDAVLSADEVRAYKPRAGVYGLAVGHFGVPAGRLSFVSSNGWDAVGAAEFGMCVTWCNRSALPVETLGAPPIRTILTLRELLDRT